MTRVLILGGSGMLGHKLWQRCQPHFETWTTVRTNYQKYASLGIFDDRRILGNVNAVNFDSIVQAVTIVRPDVIINCIGIIKQLSIAKDPIISLSINSLFPHRLANLCSVAGVRLIHISTDCVFSGQKGMYTERDVSDAEDLYGRTKYLGEVSNPGCLTLRTSIIGRELQSTSGLVEWFLSNQDVQVQGYTRAIFSGFTTLALAKIIINLIEDYPDLNGLYQVSSAAINKYELLKLIGNIFELDTIIEPYADIVIDRSLDSQRFWSQVIFEPPSWLEMITAMANDTTPYQQWRAK